MAHLPKRLWDSKKRAVRQGKQQVWEVDGELKLNGGNTWDEANPEEFEVYDKGVEEPQEPYVTYDKEWDPIEPPIEPPTPSVSFGTLFSFAKSYIESDGLHNLTLTLKDFEGNAAMDVLYQYDYGTGDFANCWVHFYDTDLGNRLSGMDWNWLTEQDDIVGNMFFNFGVLPIDANYLTNAISMDGFIINQTLVYDLNLIINGDHDTFINFMINRYTPDKVVSLDVENRVGTNIRIDVNNCGHLFSDGNRDWESYIEFDLTNHIIQPLGIFQLSYYYDFLFDEGQQTYTLQNKFNYYLDFNKIVYIDGNEYNVEDFWYRLWGKEVPSSSDTYAMSYLNMEMRYTWINDMMYGNIYTPLVNLFAGVYGYTMENCPAVLWPAYNKETASYDNQNGIVYLGGRTDQNVYGEIRTFRGISFELINGGDDGVCIHGVNGGNPQADDAIYSFFDALGNETLKALLDYDQMIASDGTGTLYSTFFNLIGSLFACGIPEGSTYSLNAMEYESVRNGVLNSLNDIVSSGNSIVSRNI